MNRTKSKILIVDDHPNNHRVYKRSLEPLDLEIVDVMSGQQALEVAHVHDFFLILMDVQMPEMDGFETASLILGHPDTRHIPIIFVTAIAKDEKFEFKGYKGGAVDYLTKPFDSHILKSKVSVFLELHLQKKQLQSTLYELKKTFTDLENTNRSILEFTEIVSGYVSTPLQLISSSALLLKMELENNGSEKELNYLKRIDKSIEFMKSQIEALTSINGIKTDTDGRDEIKIDLNQVADQVIANISSLMKQTQGRITKDALPSINANENQIKRLFSILLENGLQYHQDGIPPKVHISSQIVNDLVKLKFKDNGRGFDEDFVEWIFTPFKRLLSSPYMDGTGIGLTKAKSIVTRMRGSIYATSQAKHGSEFVVILPLESKQEIRNSITDRLQSM